MKQAKLKVAQSCSFCEMIKSVQQKALMSQKEFEKNGGMCLHCGKNPGEKDSQLNPFHCKQCNAETQKLIDQLRGPGFMQLKIGIPK